MVEIELKFQLPASQKKAVLDRLKKVKAQKILLQAKYYDTPDRLLAQSGIAIRLRKEADTWVQTFKATTNSHLHRIEHEVDLGPQEPELDLSVYQHQPIIKKLLDEVLANSKAQLQLQFQTNVQRYHHTYEVNGSCIEACLDDGQLISNNGTAQICEVEFELKEGDVLPLIELAQDWVKQYGLWLDVRSKAERGNLLAMGKLVSPAASAKKIVLTKKISTEQALQHIVENCLNHLLPNAAAIAGQVAEAEHTHQARVAIRRLRTALKHLEKWSDQVDPAWRGQLSTLFKQLGTTRDIDVISADILPQLRDDGAPTLQLSASQNHEIPTAVLFTDAPTVILLLDLLMFIHAESTSNKHEPTLKNRASKKLEQLYKHISPKAHAYSHLDLEQRHKMRKQTKELRYLIEFFSCLYSEKSVKHYLKQLKQTLNHLGQYIDILMAEQIFEQQLEQNVHFWFALGWSRAQEKHLLNQADQAMKQLTKIETFW